MLKALLERTDWDNAESVFTFFSDVLTRLSLDYRQQTPPAVMLSDQLKRIDSLVDLYDFLFSFDYLKPKYRLQWGGR